MRPTSISIAVPNCLLFIKDARNREFPDIDGNAAVWSTPSCVAVMCRPEVDGDTEIRIGLVGEVGLGGRPLFDSLLKTPSRRLALEIVPGEKILEVGVPDRDTRVRVWTDGHQCAEKVVIALG